MTLTPTARGRRSRERILQAAATLFHERGVHATSVDAVLEASGAGKSQLYHYFPSKTALVREVLAYQLERVIQGHLPLLERLDSWEGIETWFAAVVDWHTRREFLGGCPIGSLAAEMADYDDGLDGALARAFGRWESYLADGLVAMRERGELRPDADPVELAEAALAMVQGGILLARTKKEARPLLHAMDGALCYLRAWAT